MSNMQKFHEQLFNNAPAHGSLLKALARLTEVGLPQVRRLQSVLEWVNW